MWWLLEVSVQKLESLISSVTSYFDTSHSNAIRVGESLAFPSVKHGHHEEQALLVRGIHRRKMAGWYLLLILERQLVLKEKLEEFSLRFRHPLLRA